MKIIIGNDHTGVTMKQTLYDYLSENHDVINVGTDDDTSVDYPDIAKQVSTHVLADDAFGILICGTGIGMSIAANKIKGIRAAHICDDQTAALAKKHNNANIIAFGARTHTIEQAKKMVDAYMQATFELRHQQRIDKITESET